MKRQGCRFRAGALLCLLWCSMMALPCRAEVFTLFLDRVQEDLLAEKRAYLALEEALEGGSFFEEMKKTVSLGTVANSGSTDALSLNVALELESYHVDDLFRFEASHFYGKEDDVKEVDKSFISAEYSHFYSDRFYAGFSPSFLRNDVLEVDYVLFSGVKLGYYFVKEEATRWDFYVAPGYVFEKTGGGREEFFGPKFGNRFEHVFGNGVRVFEAAEVLVPVEDGDAYQVLARAGVEFPIVSGLSVNLSIQAYYDHDPVVGVERDDVSYLTSLVYSF